MQTRLEVIGGLKVEPLMALTFIRSTVFIVDGPTKGNYLYHSKIVQTKGNSICQATVSLRK